MALFDVELIRDARAALWALALRGNRFECACCGGRFRRLAPHGVPPRANARCPRCNSMERHRALWMFLRTKTDLWSAPRRALHIAPELALKRALTRAPNIEYVSGDVRSPLAAVKLDVQDLPYPDGFFDLVLCNHVLEHVDDDRRAMRELCRVLSPAGWAVLLAPIDPARAVTFEDPTVTDPQERERVFGQRDHVRVYGRDYADRLRGEGFDVEGVDFVSTLEPSVVERHALLPAEDIFVCRRARAAAPAG